MAKITTRSEFSKQLEDVQGLVSRLGEKAEADIRAVGLAARGDRGAATGVLRGRKAADRLRNEIESNCLDIMLLQQPLIGEDLRFVSGAFRVVSDLYQIDNMTRDIAFLMAEISKKSMKPLIETFSIMSDKTASMLARALDAFSAADTDLAHEVMDSDDEMDRMYQQTEEMVAGLIRESDGQTKSLPELLMVAKYFERIGDQAARVAAWGLFRATGERVLTNADHLAELEDEEETIGEAGE
ncbi:MAG TPA: phosphate transport system regulatory protein PhoU [Candidatus Coprovicinus avistercoris]|uniref:Phosphate-specific transport system accessory protein PhoU n=1 Tax=Candidatus Coprovicinus avistercoris TaxID=2840754 RepID=A0A9D1L409_9ACTN|nr:phosphate transport system regulatory protein PhoU [Candidatus Coprovicinus avistercoris]